jgi:P27 family predicted phage terminase small subunit
MTQPKTQAGPVCPEFIVGEARKEWQRIVRLLGREGTVNALDRAALAAYCQAWAQWREAGQKVLDSGGPVIATPNGCPITNPWQSIQTGAFRRMHAMLRELGLSPAARRRVKNKPVPTGKATSGLAILSAGRIHDRA